MNKFSKVLAIAAVIAVVLLVGVGVGWLATRRTPVGIEGSPPRVQASKPAQVPRTSFFPTNRPRPAAAVVSGNRIAPTSTPATNIIADWEQRLDDILGSEGEETAKAKQLLALFPNLPEDGQVEVAQHLSNLLSDQEYAPLGKLLTDSKLPEAVLDVLVVDVLNRPNALKLPLLLDIARDSEHPKAAEAKDLLELYLEEDYGNDWNKWQAKMQQWLRENPD